MRILRGLGIALAALVGALAAIVVGIGIAARFSDGPIGPFPGGPLLTGTLVSEPVVDWSFAHGREIELQLVEPPGSRIIGAVAHEGQLFGVCDLGFIAHRLPNSIAGWMLSPIRALKRWHEHAVLDGRVVLRIAGQLYERQAVRETAPERLAALRSIVDELANEYLSSPLLDVPTDPDDIWFFRMDPRP